MSASEISSDAGSPLRVLCGRIALHSDSDVLMSSVNRQAKLETMLEAQPEDQVLRYMLAMEMEKNGDREKSLAHMRKLMADPVPYVPAFLMAGQHLSRIGQIEDAKSCYRAGIKAAKTQGNAHAEGEMGQFLLALDQAE